MITGINCWAQSGRVTASIHIGYDLFTGAPVARGQGSYLAVAFEPAGTLIDSDLYDSEIVDVAFPAFEAWDAAKLDMWLQHYVRELDVYVAECGVPKFKEVK